MRTLLRLHPKRLLRVTFFLLGTLLLVSSVTLAKGDSLRLISWSSTDPRWRWSEITVFGLEDNQRLDTVWWHYFGSLSGDIRVFPETATLLMSDFEEGTLVFALERDTVVATIKHSERNAILQMRQIATGQDLGKLLMTSWNAGVPGSDIAIVNLETGEIDSLNMTKLSGELRLAGFRPPADPDYVSIRNPQTNMSARHLARIGVDANAFPMPESLTYNSPDSNWALLLQEKTFLVLWQDSLLNIYDRAQKKWHSVWMSGFRGCWTLGGWIVIDEALLIDPISDRRVLVPPEKCHKLLWIDSNEVYYRNADTLFGGRIDGNAVVDSKPLLIDPRIEHVEWAYKKRSTSR